MSMVWTRLSSEGVKGSRGCCCWVGRTMKKVIRTTKNICMLKIEAMELWPMSTLVSKMRLLLFGVIKVWLHEKSSYSLSL